MIGISVSLFVLYSIIIRVTQVARGSLNVNLCVLPDRLTTCKTLSGRHEVDLSLKVDFRPVVAITQGHDTIVSEAMMNNTPTSYTSAS
jgi:hypothetical protein